MVVTQVGYRPHGTKKYTSMCGLDFLYNFYKCGNIYIFCCPVND